jgi:hypothetical protein
MGREGRSRFENGVEECDVGLSAIVRKVHGRGRKQVLDKGVPSVAVTPSGDAFGNMCDLREEKGPLQDD